MANGSTKGARPGVIQPPVEIAFNKIGQIFDGYGDDSSMVFSGSQYWASFDASTNPLSFIQWFNQEPVKWGCS